MSLRTLTGVFDKCTLGPVDMAPASRLISPLGLRGEALLSERVGVRTMLSDRLCSMCDFKEVL